MEIITIIIKWHMMEVKQGTVKKSRRVWTAPGLEIRVHGPFSGSQFDRAQHIAIQECEKRHIPLISLRKVK